MKVIVAGTRSIADYDRVARAIESAPFDVTEIVSGCAPGPDQLGALYGYLNDIPVKEFPAEWDVHGRAAGPIRNQAMSEYADALILIWNGQSRGSKDMLERAKAENLEIFVDEA